METSKGTIHMFFLLCTHTHTNVPGQGGFGRGIETRGEHDLRTSYGRFDSETVLHFVYGRERSVTRFGWIFSELEQGWYADGGTLSTSSGDGSYSSQIVFSRWRALCKLFSFIIRLLLSKQTTKNKIHQIHSKQRSCSKTYFERSCGDGKRSATSDAEALFLRDFINTQTRNLLPDVGNDYLGEGGTVFDSIDFTAKLYSDEQVVGTHAKYSTASREANR